MSRYGCACLVALVAATCVSPLHAAYPDRTETPIDRHALVSRHNVHITSADVWAPLSLGNGRFCFTADATGLQTCEAHYAKGIPPGTMADWAWHTFPRKVPAELADTFVTVDTYDRKVTYPINMKSPSTDWLRANPHRFSIGQIGLVLRNLDSSRVGAGDLQNIEQTLDLWRGLLTSRFEIEGQPVKVETCCHPEVDAVGARIESPLLATSRLGVALAFAYPTGDWGKRCNDWDKRGQHSTSIAARSPTRVDLTRIVDRTRYGCTIVFPEGASLTESGDHRYLLTAGRHAKGLEFVVTFSKQEPIKRIGTSFAEVKEAAETHWNRYWTTGGAVDLSLSEDPRWRELERRIVLSQYLTAIQGRGRYPPPETGLTCNSWHGKFHLEMHWWHSVHFALWGRLDVLERQLDWYERMLPAMRATARRQGYDGVRWGKMCGPDGGESPSGIGPLLIWQQAHPIYYAELCYRERGSDATLERYRELVLETAAFMASFAHWDEIEARYVLGPPLIPAQESYDYKATYNPTFELCYWYWGLATAQRWRERLGMKREPAWDHVLEHLSPLPEHDGIYAAIEPEPFTRTWDHPSMLAALGVLPKTPLVEEQIMRRTAREVYETWNWARTWGWDYPMLAMTAARTGNTELAVDALFIESVKNRYLKNGHNYQADHLPVYLPGNGGLLTAVAMMAAGWDGCPDRLAPGFPDDDRWHVRWEGLRRMP